MTSEPKRRAQAQARADRGKEGEALAARFLQQKGFRIRGRNFRTRFGEIDIVAEDQGQIVFVEVRSLGPSRRHLPEETIQLKKQQRLSRTALLYLRAHRLEDRTARFDVVAVEEEGAGRILRHVPDAFEIWED
ncbi:MAG: YraN family protein [bacterium]